MRTRDLALPAALLLALGVGGWGVAQYRGRLGLAVQAENQYARAFHELTFYMQGIEQLSAKVLVSASHAQRTKTLSDIWRNSFAAQSQLGQLPLTNVSLTRTQDFLARIQTFTYDVGMRNLDEGNRITEKEWSTLNSFHKQSQLISRTLNRMSASMSPTEFRWTKFGAQVASAQVGGVGGPASDTKRLAGQPVVKSLVMLEDGLSRMPSPEVTAQPALYRPKAKAIVGERITPAQALRIARGFLGPAALQARNLRLEGQNSGQIPSYSLVATSKAWKGVPSIYVDVTRRGGHVMWMLNQRTVNRLSLGLARTRAIGLKYLEARGMDVVPVASQRLDNIAIHSYAAYYGGYVVYPELVKVQVACDNGEVLGVDAVPYLTFHDPARKVSPPDFTQAQAQQKVDHHLAMDQVRRAVILNDRYQQVACYEFDGVLDGEHYRVYINTTNLDEEKVERSADAGFEQL